MPAAGALPVRLLAARRRRQVAERTFCTHTRRLRYRGDTGKFEKRSLYRTIPFTHVVKNISESVTSRFEVRILHLVVGVQVQARQCNTEASMQGTYRFVSEHIVGIKLQRRAFAICLKPDSEELYYFLYCCQTQIYRNGIYVDT